MRLWTCSLREFRRRPGRTLLTLLGIAIAVATLLATTVTLRTVHQAYHEMFACVAGPACLEVAAPAFAAFDPGFVGRLGPLSGVKAVIPRIQVTAALAGATGPMPVQVLGIEPASLADEGFRIHDGSLPDEDNGIVLDASFAQANGLAEKRLVHLWAPSGPVELPLTGTLEPSGPGAFPGSGLVLMALGTAQRLFALPGKVNNVQVLLADGADRGQVEAELSSRLPAGLRIEPPGTRTALAQSTLLSAEQGLSLLSIVALVAAGFVILNTIFLNLGERRRQLATLRALGATRAQLRGLLLREALLLGTLGTVAGLAGGLVLGLILLRSMEQFLGIALPPLEWTARPFLLAAVVGPGTALAAAWLPARQASRREPLEELLGRPAGEANGLPPWTWLAGLLLTALALILELGLCSGWLPPAASRSLLAPGIALLLVGGVLTLPALHLPLLRLVARGLRRLLGLEGTLAVYQLQRHPTRTGITAGVLFLALAVAISFGTSLLNMLGDLEHWYGRTIVADFLVRASMPDTAFVLAAPLPETLATEIGQEEGVAAVDRIAFVSATVNEQPVLVLARTLSPGQPLPIDLTAGIPPAVLRGLRDGEVTLATALAQQLGVGIGDTITLETPRGPRGVRIAGTMTEYAAGGRALYMEWGTARQLLDVAGVHVFLVRATPGAAAVLASRLQAFCDRHALLLQSNEQLRGLVQQSLARVVGVLWALMALAFVVASLGIVNTLTMNVLEQTREIGILRALGMKRGQVRKVILFQALLLGLVSLLPGALAGLGLAYVINRSTGPVLGQQVAFRVHPSLILGSCGMALLVGILAAVLPARRAVRMEVLRSLQQ